MLINQSLKSTLFKGIFWTGVDRFSVQIIQFIISIILARLLVPSEFGLIAMTTIFIAIAQVFIDSGFSNALIQKKNRSSSDFSTVFVFNFIISLVVYFLLYGIAPYVSDFYKESQLTSIIRWVSLNLILSGVSIVQRSILLIELRFKTTALISLTAVLISGILGIILAYLGKGVWALIIQILASNAITALLFFFLSKWKISMHFSRTSFQNLFSFGSKLLTSSLIHSIYTNLYSLVIGKFYSSTEVGYYNRMATFALFPSSNLITVINRAIFPIQCQIQDENERLKSIFNSYLKLSIIFVFPIMIGMCAMATSLISVILTDKWLPATPYFQILCFAFMWSPLMMINNQILIVKGRSDLFLKAEILKKIVAITILILTINSGLKILCYGLVFYHILDFLIIIPFTKKVIQTSYKEQISNLAPTLALSLFMGAIIYFSINLVDSNIGKVLFGTLIGFVVYLIGLLIFHSKELKILQLMSVKMISNFSSRV